MFRKKGSSAFKTLLEGVQMRPLVWEEKTLLCEFHLEKGRRLPLHSHPYEQTGYLISGKLQFHIGAEWYEATPGDSWCIPQDVLHEVVVEEEAHLVELFSPVRPDYLPQSPD
ncbi:MAG TPA: cupin domain-containing protein [Prolixibacteraceae bacterium]|nr:cupin domain-containing protein [Prolixibacteraceae bacterium]